MHFKKGDLIIVLFGNIYSMPLIIHNIESVGNIQSNHVSNIDILFYRTDGTIGRVDLFHVFHAQECNAFYCNKFLKNYKIKQ
jgi:hypothetical protein